MIVLHYIVTILEFMLNETLQNLPYFLGIQKHMYITILVRFLPLVIDHNLGYKS